MKPVIVVGGGLSGLAAAVSLTSVGIPVLLVEQKPALGGRAYSFVDSTTGDVIDNGQHVLIAGYEHAMRFLQTIGTGHLLSVQPEPELLFHHPVKGFRRFRLPGLPPPLHLIMGVLTCRLFSMSDRMRLLRAGMGILRFRGTEEGCPDDRTIEEWLDSVGQSEETKRSFWEPLAVSIMNEDLAKAPARTFVRAIQKAFFQGRRSAAVALPRVDLSALFVDNAARYIVLNGGKTLCGVEVVEVMYDGSRATGVRLRDNAVLDCTALILAVPHTHLSSILPSELRSQQSFSAMVSIPPSPIVSVHLWFPADVMRDDFVALIGRRVQWLFRDTTINGQSAKKKRISAVISAAHRYVGCSNEELMRIAMDDIRSAYPSAAQEPSHYVVIREKRATYSSAPRTELLRPSQRTTVPNLFLGGDWTDTGYPATIEGAVVSGELCASLVQEWMRGEGRHDL